MYFWDVLAMISAGRIGGSDFLSQPGGFQVIADELLVQRRLAFPRFVRGQGPEPRGIRGEDFVDENQVVPVQAEFELRVGDDDPLRKGVERRPVVEVQADLADLFGQGGADDFLHLLEGDVLVVADLGLGRGREDRLGEAVRFAEAVRAA